jgi:very-short-patch-repair endonuclease
MSRSHSNHQSTNLIKVLGVRDPVVVSGTRDQRIAAIASRQHGRVGRSQLRAAGITDNVIAGLIARGALHREHPSVFAVGHHAPMPLQREAAALLACADDTVLSHLTAATLWGLPAHAPDQVEVLICGRQTAQPRGVRVHRTVQLPARDVRIKHHLPLTSPARTLLDIADGLTPRELERALDEALVARIVRISQIADVLARARGRRGAPRLSALIEHAAGTTVTRSQAEERFLALVRAADLPQPEVNYRTRGFEVDFLWRERRLVVEVDGYRYHSSRSAFERDSAKGAKLTAAGLQVMRVTWLQMEGDSYGVVARLAQALARARPSRPGAPPH